MRFRNPVLVALVVIGLTTTVSVQKAQQATNPAIQGNEAIERAHENLAGTKDKAAEASRLTDSVAGALPDASSTLTAKIPHKNLVDDSIFGRIERDHIPHSPLAGDEEFLRRAYLDATGRLPEPAVVREFIASKDSQKRDKLIDSLIGSVEFTEQWAWFFGDLFQNQKDNAYWWMKQWLKVDRPYNETFAEIVTGAAKTQVMMPALYFHYPAMYASSRNVPSDPDDYHLTNRLDFVDATSVNLSRIFLGINIECISCHDGAGHLEPLNYYLSERKRSDFQSQAAFLGKFRLVSSVNHGFATDPQDSILDDEAPAYNSGNDAPFYTPAESRFPRDGKVHEPAFLLSGEKPKPGENPRMALARIAPTHIQFSRAAVNLIWSKLMVVGFVEPYDGFDMARLDPKNPPPKPWTLQPTNPELLDALANDFRSNNFSLHRVIKTIMKSNAYQLSAQFPGAWKDAYIPYYARRFVRVLTGSEVADAIAQATDRPYQFGANERNRAAMAAMEVQQDVKKAEWVKQLSEPVSVRTAGKEGNEIYALLQAFFEGSREGPAVLGNNATAVQAMLMMASSVVNSRVQATNGSRVQKLLQSGKTDSEVLDELFLATLSRRPMPNEREVALQLMEKDRQDAAEKIQWALLNTTEFLLNH